MNNINNLTIQYLILKLLKFCEIREEESSCLVPLVSMKNNELEPWSFIICKM